MNSSITERPEYIYMRITTILGLIKPLAALPALLALGACDLQMSTVGGTTAVQDISSIKVALDTADVAVQKQTVLTIIGTGYGTISAQPARNINQKRLMAIRVARLDAMRELTEQVYGLRINSRTTVIDAVLQNDTTRASVDGTVRGARTLRINPVGSDTYEVVLELDRDMVARILKAVR
jgi:hypothetical protein